VGSLEGIMWAYQWGSRRELVEVYYYLREFHALSRTIYAREGSLGVQEDKSLPDGVWLFITEEK